MERYNLQIECIDGIAYKTWTDKKGTRKTFELFVDDDGDYTWNWGVTCCDLDCPEFTKSLEALRTKENISHSADTSTFIPTEEGQRDIVKDMEELFGPDPDTNENCSDFIAIPRDEYEDLKKSLCRMQSTLYDICSWLGM